MQEEYDNQYNRFEKMQNAYHMFGQKGQFEKSIKHAGQKNPKGYRFKQSGQKNDKTGQYAYAFEKMNVQKQTEKESKLGYLPLYQLLFCCLLFLFFLFLKQVEVEQNPFFLKIQSQIQYLHAFQILEF